MAFTPDPSLELTTFKGTTRTLDDWMTYSHLALIVLPGRPEAAAYVGIGKRIATTFGESDCRPAFLVSGSERDARRVLGEVADTHFCFHDPDGAAVKALGVTLLPAFVHIRLDCSVASNVGGWDPAAWGRAVDQLAEEMHWTKPLVPAPGDPPPFWGWSV